MDRRKYARQQAAEFNARTLAAIAKVLEKHSNDVVQFALQMQARVDAAEALVVELAAGLKDSEMVQEPRAIIFVTSETQKKFLSLAAEIERRTL